MKRVSTTTVSSLRTGYVILPDDQQAIERMNELLASDGKAGDEGLGLGWAVVVVFYLILNLFALLVVL